MIILLIILTILNGIVTFNGIKKENYYTALFNSFVCGFCLAIVISLII